MMAKCCLKAKHAKSQSIEHLIKKRFGDALALLKPTIQKCLMLCINPKELNLDFFPQEISNPQKAKLVFLKACSN